MSDPIRSEGQPHDRLTRLCDAMVKAFQGHPEYQEAGDHCVIFLDSGVEHKGGLVTVGYEEDVDAIAAIMTHLKAIFEANGMKFEVISMDEPMGQG